MKNLLSRILILTIPLLSSQLARAESPWLYQEGFSTISYSFVTESFDEKFIGTNDADPIDDITQITHWLNYTTGLTDNLTFSFLTGYTETEQDGNENGNFFGRADTLISAKWGLQSDYLDEIFSTSSVRGGITIAGSYDRGEMGRPHAPGDKADGLELFFQAARFITDRFELQTELGYRLRLDDVPDELVYGLTGVYSLNTEWSFSLEWKAQLGLGGTDIGDPDFENKFHETREDRSTFNLNASYTYQNIMAMLGYARVIELDTIAEARNTGESEIMYLMLMHGF